MCFKVRHSVQHIGSVAGAQIVCQAKTLCSIKNARCWKDLWKGGYKSSLQQLPVPEEALILEIEIEEEV